jgi:hypothetical protein
VTMSLLTYGTRRLLLAAFAAMVAVSLTFLVVASNRFYPVAVPLTQQYADHVLGLSNSTSATRSRCDDRSATSSRRPSPERSRTSSRQSR